MIRFEHLATLHGPHVRPLLTAVRPRPAGEASTSTHSWRDFDAKTVGTIQRVNAAHLEPSKSMNSEPQLEVCISVPHRAPAHGEARATSPGQLLFRARAAWPSDRAHGWPKTAAGRARSKSCATDTVRELVVSTRPACASEQHQVIGDLPPHLEVMFDTQTGQPDASATTHSNRMGPNGQSGPTCKSSMRCGRSAYARRPASGIPGMEKPLEMQKDDIKHFKSLLEQPRLVPLFQQFEEARKFISSCIVLL